MRASLSQPRMLYRGQQCRVQTLLQGIPQGMPSASPFLDLSVFEQRGSQSPDIRPSSLFLKHVGLASPGLGVQYSPISRGSQSCWCPELSIPSIPSELEGQSDNSRMKSNNRSQAFQVLNACTDIVFCLCLLMLFCWVILLIQCNYEYQYSLTQFKGSGWRVARTVEGSLWGVKTEIWKLESLRQQMARHRLTTTNEWRSSNGTGRPYRRSS